MRNFKAIPVVLLLMLLVPLTVNANNMKAYKQMVEDSDAVQALALANKWKWSEETITSYVTPEEVIFEFPDDTIKKVPLPEDKMVVAIAPYLTYTHE